MRTANFNGHVNARRIKAKTGLLLQLERGKKNECAPLLTRATVGLEEIPLTELDVKRINKEIKILEGKIVTNDVAVSTKNKKYRGARG